MNDVECLSLTKDHAVTPEFCWTPTQIHAACSMYKINSPSVKYARMLVLGCGGGEGLLSIAAEYPFARVVGIDLITEGNEIQQQKMMSYAPANIELYALSVEQILGLQDNGWDYVVIQNAFSYLNQQITSALLQHLGGLLAENGIIIFQWASLPGTAYLETLRDALQIYSGQVTSLEMQVARAKLMLASLSLTASSPAMREELRKSERLSDTLFAHHYLETSRESEYLVEFHSRINRLGLCYVGDMDTASELPGSHGFKIEELHAALGENQQKVLLQQNLDLLTNRPGRFSILTREKHAGKVSVLPLRSELKKMRFAGSFRRTASNDRNVYSSLAGHDGLKVATTDEVTLAVLDLLGDAWPRSISFEQIVFHCEIVGKRDVKDTESAVENTLWTLFQKRIPALHICKGLDGYSTDEDLHVHVLASVTAQLAANPQAEWVINGWGERVSLTEAERHQLQTRIEVSSESWAVLDTLCFKGLLNAGGVGWKHFLQEMIRHCPPEAISKTVSALFLYSSDESAFGFMTSEQKKADKAKNVAEFVEDDVELTQNQQQIIRAYTLRGQYSKAYEVACSLLEGGANTGAKEYFLCTLARRIGDYDTALIRLARALSYHSTSVFLYSELAFAFVSCKYHWQAWRLASSILRCNKKSSPEWYLLASIHYDFKRFEQSEYCARQAFALAPESKLIATLLGGTLCEQTKTNEGIAFLRKGIKNKEIDYSLMTGLGFIMSHSAEAGLNDILEVHFDYAKEVKKWAQKQNFSGYLEKNKDPTRKLRIGFVSGDFRDRHPVSFFFSPIWHSLDRAKCQLFAYSNIQATHENEGTERFKTTADHWRNVRYISDCEMAEMIKLDEIDILVDLSGYTSDHRLPVFALKPAPVQISWVGYHATTGLEAMDYYATIFPVKKSAELEAQFSEKLIYMYLPKNFDQAGDNMAVNTLPALRNGYFTFGSFNRTNKLNDRVFDAWAAVLKNVPDSRMVVGNMPQSVWSDVTLQFTRRGIDTSRFELRELAAMNTYLSYHHDVDLLLDTFPFTGGTVTSHAAWMGVPTVSFAGEMLVSRQGAAIMYSLGLPQFVAENVEDYVHIATQWADKREELNQIRQELRSHMSIQTDTQQQIGIMVEEMFRTCWKTYCAGKQPESFSIGELPYF
ncbi:methyltransferase [Enterobacter ludwigii]